MKKRIFFSQMLKVQGFIALSTKFQGAITINTIKKHGYSHIILRGLQMNIFRELKYT